MQFWIKKIQNLNIIGQCAHLLEELDCIILACISTLSGIVSPSNLKYSLKFMTTKSFTSSSVNIFKWLLWNNLGIYKIRLIIGTKFHQIQVIATMMKNYDHSVQIIQNPNWLYIPDHSYRILIIGDSRSGKKMCYWS